MLLYMSRNSFTSFWCTKGVQESMWIMPLALCTKLNPGQKQKVLQDHNVPINTPAILINTGFICMIWHKPSVLSRHTQYTMLIRAFSLYQCSQWDQSVCTQSSLCFCFSYSRLELTQVAAGNSSWACTICNIWILFKAVNRKKKNLPEVIYPSFIWVGFELAITDEKYRWIHYIVSTKSIRTTWAIILLLLYAKRHSGFRLKGIHEMTDHNFSFCFLIFRLLLNVLNNTHENMEPMGWTNPLFKWSKILDHVIGSTGVSCPGSSC